VFRKVGYFTIYKNKIKLNCVYIQKVCQHTYTEDVYIQKVCQHTYTEDR